MRDSCAPCILFSVNFLAFLTKHDAMTTVRTTRSMSTTRSPLFDSMMVTIPEVVGAVDNMISSQTDDFCCSLL